MEPRKVVQRIPIKLYPEQLQDPEAGINASIKSMLYKYNIDMEGVPLSYSKIKVDKTMPTVSEDCPILFVHAKVTFKVFSPKRGDVLKGIVNKITVDHVGVLVHDHFNASVPCASLPKHYEFSFADSTFVDKKTGKAAFRVDDEVEVLVDFLESSHGVLSINGTLKGC